VENFLRGRAIAAHGSVEPCKNNSSILPPCPQKKMIEPFFEFLGYANVWDRDNRLFVFI
jgi:hypothetical protein